METILIVDDERSNLNLLAEWLDDDYTHQGYGVNLLCSLQRRVNT